MEKIMNYRIFIGVLIIYMLLIYFGGMTMKKIDTSKIEDNNYTNVI